MSLDRTWQEALSEVERSKEADLRFVEMTREESSGLSAYLNARLFTPIVGLTAPASDVYKVRDFTNHPLWPLLTRLTRGQSFTSPESWIVALYSSELETLENDLEGQMNHGNALLENAKIAFGSLKQKWEGAVG